MSSDEMSCRACGSLDIQLTVIRETLPAMQNYVFRKRELAKAAEFGRFALAVCESCGFAWNRYFDSTLLNYDEGYDNSVPSSVMREYYEEVATQLLDRYPVAAGGLIVDVGCGKGDFLKVLSEINPSIRGLGIDPSYEGDMEIAGGRIKFVRDLFSESLIHERPSVIVCRHVLEHIEGPVGFLRSLRSATSTHNGVPFFFEVPDVNWIVDNGAFWDFCYEHCNYFSADSLPNTLAMAGFAVGQCRNAFGGQYLWIDAINQAAENSVGATSASSGASRLSKYADEEASMTKAVAKCFSRMKRDGWILAIWGMATKGIVFSFLVDSDAALFDFCIDANPNKHRCFVPLTGHSIDSPEVLRQTSGSRLAIVVMNPNYLSEIRSHCARMSLDPVFMDARGLVL